MLALALDLWVEVLIVALGLLALLTSLLCVLGLCLSLEKSVSTIFRDHLLLVVFFSLLVASSYIFNFFQHRILVVFMRISTSVVNIK